MQLCIYNISLQKTRRYYIKKCILRVQNASPLEWRTHKIGFRFQPIASGFSRLQFLGKGFIFGHYDQTVGSYSGSYYLVFHVVVSLVESRLAFSNFGQTLISNENKIFSFISNFHFS